MDLLPDSVLLSTNTLHVLGSDLDVAGFVGSTDRVALNAVQSMVITGLVQAGNRINAAAGVAPSWTLSQLTSNTLVQSQMSGGSITVEQSGVLDATSDIRIRLRPAQNKWMW